MSHLLSTINPEAAARIQPPMGKPDLPPIASVVQYHARAGYGRNGRTTFPALVMGHEAGRKLALVVFFDAGDMIDESLVEEYGVGRESHAWEPIADGRAVAEAMRGTITALHTRVGEAEQALGALRATVLGDFDAPGVSIIHIMQDFENRLRALASENQALRTAAGPAPKSAKSKK